MNEKLKSRKLWITILANVVSICVIFTDIGGIAGTVAAIIGVIASPISYLLSEGSVDIACAELEKKKNRRINKYFKKEGW